MGMYCSLRGVTAEEARRLRAAPAEEALPLRARGAAVSLEKAWHGLHFLLTGSAWEGEVPLGFLLHGGETLGADDPDEVPAGRLFTPAETRALDQTLAQISDDQLWQRYDPERMSAEGIYPDIWDEDEDDLKDEYLEYFHAMKALIHRASAANQALLVSIG